MGVGDTLWSIAGRYFPDRRTDEVVWAIREVNGLEGPQGPVLQPQPNPAIIERTGPINREGRPMLERR